MKRWLAIGLTSAAVIWLTVIAVRQGVRDPEVSNPADEQDMPDSYASDATLFEAGQFRVQAQKAASTPYFIELADGRYSCGYTDAAGNTRTLFTKQPVAFEVFWDDEAWSRWLAVREKHGQP